MADEQHQATRPAQLNRTKTQTLYAESMAQIVLGYPMTRIVLHNGAEASANADGSP